MNDIIITKDLSPTLYSKQFNATYHSVNGALQESMLVFIQNGIVHYLCTHPQLQKIHLLEVGLGTGLNCFLTYLEHQKNFADKIISYTAIEKYPLGLSIISALSGLSPFSENKDVFQKIHSDELVSTFDHHFTLQKHYEDILNAINKIDTSIDVVYYDAFAPSAQSEMWDREIFEKIYSLMKPDGILVTYCAQGNFKRTLKAIGFKVEALTGAAGKREMTRATKTSI